MTSEASGGWRLKSGGWKAKSKTGAEAGTIFVRVGWLPAICRDSPGDGRRGSESLNVLRNYTFSSTWAQWAPGCALRESRGERLPAPCGPRPALPGRVSRFSISLCATDSYRKMHSPDRSFLTPLGAIDLQLEGSFLAAGVGPELWQALCSLSARRAMLLVVFQSAR